MHPFKRNDRIVLLASIAAARQGTTGVVTHADDFWLNDDQVGVRWQDGVQTVLSAAHLGFEGHPDFTKPEEVEAWLAT